MAALESLLLGLEERGRQRDRRVHRSHPVRMERCVHRPERPNIQVLDINAVATGEYNYVTDERAARWCTSLRHPVVLVDDQRHLFCVTTFNDLLFVGFDSYYDYDENTTMYDQPVSITENGGSWFVLGSERRPVP